ncbi:HIRAN domain-containing protein [Nocardioides sp. CN2-186]|uniref:HIRAN domain-containing protein n=1 Tax=Nocardioides tweenelious TaxID=3156607 RepID=UPI0032B5A5F4
MKFFRRRDTRPAPQLTVRAEISVPTLCEPVEMAGTTTHGAAALAGLFASMGLAGGGLLEQRGRLVPEPENPIDPNAVAVHVAGTRVGYVPSFIARGMARDRTLECQVQMWAAPTPKGLRVRGWLFAGDGPAQWPHTASNPPAVTVEERRAQRAADTTRMVDLALTGGGERAEQFKAGMVGRLHYLETVEPIKQLKREGRLNEALALCYGAIQAAENDREGREPAPWYTEQAAIIHRKLGERDKEEAVLRRWLAACPHERRQVSKIQKRLDSLLT